MYKMMNKKDFVDNCRNKESIMKKRKLIFITCLFLIIITGLRLSWIMYFSKSGFPEASDGVLDLRGVDVKGDKSIPLVGEWLFYDESFLKPGEEVESNTYMTVPGTWGEGEKGNQFGHGTYKLIILLDEDDDKQPYSMYFKNLSNASRVYINGELMAEQGSLSDTANGFIPENKPFQILLDHVNGRIEIIIQIANYIDPRNGGIEGSILLGSYSTLIRELVLVYSLQIIMAVVLLLHGIYSLIVYFMYKRRIEVLFLALAFFSMTIATIADDEKLLYFMLPFITYKWWSIITILSYIFASLFLVLTCKNVIANSKLIWGYVTLCLSYATSIFLMPLETTLFNMRFFLLAIFIFPAIVISFTSVKLVLSGKQGTIFLFLLMLSIGSSSIWGILKNTEWISIPRYPYFSLDIILAVLFFAVYWFQQFFRVSEDNRRFALEME